MQGKERAGDFFTDSKPMITIVGFNEPASQL